MFNIVAILLAVSFSSCTKNESDNQNGIPPSSIEQVVVIFELKYGEEKECVHNGQMFKLSITDVEDHMENCDLIDIIDQESFNKIRTHVFLRLTIGNRVNHLKVSTIPCGGGYSYLNPETEIQHLWDNLESMHSCTANQMDSSYFPETFSYRYGEGTLIKNTLFSIYLASTYTSEIYKFIFIITKK